MSLRFAVVSWAFTRSTNLAYDSRSWLRLALSKAFKVNSPSLRTIYLRCPAELKSDSTRLQADHLALVLSAVAA